MWTLEYPVYLFLLAVVPVGIWMRHFRKRRGGRLTFAFDIWKGSGFSAKWTGLNILLGFSHLLFWSGIIVFIIALAGPSLFIQERIFLSRGIDIIVVLDESPSMAAQDFKPNNRFQSAKNVIREFIAGREHDPIGLVSFGREAALRVPPTLDYGEVLRGLDSLNLMDLGDGTAIGMGIAVAALHLRSSTAEYKVIILLTDGENNAGEIPPETASDIATGLGIKIYTIGIGSQGEVPLEFTDSKSGKVYKGMYRSGFDEELLIRIAEESGGEYFTALSQNSLESIFKTIDSMETRGQKVKLGIKTIPRHNVFLVIGIFLLFGDYVIRKALLKEVLP